MKATKGGPTQWNLIESINGHNSLSIFFIYVIISKPRKQIILILKVQVLKTKLRLNFQHLNVMALAKGCVHSTLIPHLIIIWGFKVLYNLRYSKLHIVIQNISLLIC